MKLIKSTEIKIRVMIDVKLNILRLKQEKHAMNTINSNYTKNFGMIVNNKT